MNRPTARGGPGPPAARSPIPAEYERLYALYEIASALAGSTGIAQACAATVSIVTRTLQITSAVLLDATAEPPIAWTWTAEGGAPGSLEAACERARTGLAYLAPATTPAADRAPGVLGDVPSDRHFITLPLAIPEVFGVFQIQRAKPFEERDLLFIDAVVDQLAIACDRHHARALLEAARASTEEANRRLGQLQLITTAALEGLRLDDSLTAVIGALGNVFATHTAALLLADPDGKMLVRRASIGLEHGDDRGVPIDVGIARLIATAGTAIVLDDIGESAGLGPRLLANDVRSLVGAPLRGKRTVMGIIVVGAHDRGRFTPDDARLLDLAAGRIEKILERASRYEIALAAVKSRDAILGMVSHEMRGPLGTIQLWSEVLKSGARDPAHGIQVIQESVAQLNRMVGDLLDITSIEAGHLSLRTSGERANALIAEALEGIRSAAARKELRLEARVPASDPVVECDRIRILQVLTNLLSNAVKFTPDRGSITAEVLEQDGRVRFSVEDTGCGISSADLTHVFDRYWQREATAHRGRGLGLAIAKGIVESHGAALLAESEVGRGTTFSFTLPLAPTSVPPRRDE